MAEKVKTAEEISLEETADSLKKSIEAREKHLPNVSAIPRKGSQNGDSERDAHTKSIMKEKGRLAEVEARLSEIRGTGPAPSVKEVSAKK